MNVTSLLIEVLTGPQRVKYGPLPKVPLPTDDETLLRFAQMLLELLKSKPIYRRDTLIVYPYMEKRRLLIMTPHSFRSFVDRHVACFKRKYDCHGDPYDVIRSIDRETANAVLSCMDFWTGLNEIVSCNPVPMPVMGDNGEVRLLESGYDEQTKILTFG